MADIWTSPRAAKVFGQIGWPKGDRYLMQIGEQDYWCWVHEGDVVSEMDDDMAAALCRDWCEAWLLNRSDLSMSQRESQFAFYSGCAARGQSRDECLLELLEWHLAQAAEGEA